MNQEQTLELWGRCEKARTAARADGKSEDEAHAAATAVWNAWAEPLIASRKELDKAGVWAEASAAIFSTETRRRSFNPDFDCRGWNFPGDARFEHAAFTTGVRFDAATLSGDAGFHGATFSGDASFLGAIFRGNARFDGTTFTGDARFEKTTFTGYARFDGVIFTRDTWFVDATFTGGARFGGSTFKGDAWFEIANFTGDARFGVATFEGNAWFGRAIFSGEARFVRATFKGDARFSGAAFTDSVGFGQATFEGFVTLRSATFGRAASFEAILANRAFTLEGARFAGVPNFIQAHFAEAPRLDNIHVHRRFSGSSRWPEFKSWRKSWFWQDTDIPAHYRALKRLAIEGHDGDSEQVFFAGEMTSARFATDWPLPLTRANWTWLPRRVNAIPFVFWRTNAWGGFYRFWFGLLYQLLGDFGRSVLRPLMLWVVATAVATLFFLGQHEEVAKARAAMRAQGTLTSLVSYATSAYEAWNAPQACVSAEKREKVRKADGSEEEIAVVSPLRKPVREQTNAATEAFHLAFRNAFIILDGGADAAHRTFGCLYGIERYGDNPVAIVPSNVTWASGLQKAFSAVLIFLFGLALRNMLKMK